MPKNTHKHGRPERGVKRSTEYVGARLLTDDVKWLEREADRRGVTRTDLIRAAIHAAYPLPSSERSAA